MPITFNETVPTVTDIFEYAGIEVGAYLILDNNYFVSDNDDEIVLVKKDIVIAEISYIRDKMEDIEGCNKMMEFLSTTNSNYIAWK